MSTDSHATASTLIPDELDLLASLVPLAGQRIIELGCGAAQLARALLARYPDARVSGLELDERQHAKNLAAEPLPGLQFIAAGAQAVPFADGSFDLALMLKSLHHVPLLHLAGVLDEVARVLRPDGHLYVSEPVFAGPLNEVVRLFNDEQQVRAAAQAALDVALQGGRWQPVADVHFETPARFAGYADFEQRMMHVTFAERPVDDALRSRVQAAYAQHIAPCADTLTRPMRVRLLRRAG